MFVSYQGSSSNAIDQEPGDERSQEEPCLQETGHEGRHVRAEANAVLEESACIICKAQVSLQEDRCNAFPL
jgi:hypothetical protein